MGIRHAYENDTATRPALGKPMTKAEAFIRMAYMATLDWPNGRRRRKAGVKRRFHRLKRREAKKEVHCETH
jgi:hypothetical protein